MRIKLNGKPRIGKVLRCGSRWANVKIGSDIHSLFFSKLCMFDVAKGGIYFVSGQTTKICMDDTVVVQSGDSDSSSWAWALASEHSAAEQRLAKLMAEQPAVPSVVTNSTEQLATEQRLLQMGSNPARVASFADRYKRFYEQRGGAGQSVARAAA